MEKKSHQERQFEKDQQSNIEKPYAQKGEQKKKEKLKQLAKKWSKGGESKWKFDPNQDDESAPIESSSYRAKLTNRQNTLYQPKLDELESESVGMIVEVQGSMMLVLDSNKDVIDCKTFRSTVTENPEETLAVVGDTVRFKITADVEGKKNAEGLITLVQKRKTKLSRSRLRMTNRSSETEHVLAANVELIVIVASISEPPLRKGLLDRYLAFAEFSELKPLIVINKIDLESKKTVEAQIGMYRKLGYELMFVSAETESGLAALKKRLAGKISVMTGHSGVGKSSLINALTDNDLAVGEVSERTLKGLHTTTNAVMVPLDKKNGFIIDTPGIREFGLTSVAKEELRHCFTEFKNYSGDCAFTSCSHITEPNCAVKKALEAGLIEQSRYESYLALYSQAIE